MRIERTTDIQEVMKCLPFENEIRRKHRDSTKISDMILFISDMLDNPMFGMWIAYDDEDLILGYIISMIVLVPGMQRLHILRMNAKTKTLRIEFENILRKWAKEYNVKIAIMTTKTHIKALKRGFGFVPVSVNMERRI